MGALLQDNGRSHIALPPRHLVWRFCFVCLPGVARLLRPRVWPRFSLFTTQDLQSLVAEIIDELDRRLEDPDREDNCDFKIEPECGLPFRAPNIY